MSYDLPNLAYYLDPSNDPKPANPTPAPPGPSGTGSWLTAGLGSGAYGALADVGGFGEAAARAFGFNGAADRAAQFAAQERAKAATYARPDLESGSLWNPAVLGYRVAQMVPGAAAAVGGSAVAGALAPEEGVAAGMTGLGGVLARWARPLGAGVGLYPQMVGGNVQASEDYTGGPVSQRDAARALAYGVPEAAAQSVLPAKILGGLGRPLEGSVLSSVGHALKTGAITQGAATGATTYLTQQMGDPTRPLASRAQDVVTSALQGGVLGAIMGGGETFARGWMHGLAKTPTADVTPDNMTQAVDAAMQGPQPLSQMYQDLGAFGAQFNRAPDQGANSNLPEDQFPAQQSNQAPSPVAFPPTPQDAFQMPGPPPATDAANMNGPLGPTPPDLASAPNPMAAYGLYNNMPDMFPRNANDYSPVARPTPQEPVNTRVATGSPENDNAGQPPSSGPAAPQLALDLGAGPGAPVDDDQPFKWASLRASLQKATKGLPEALKGQKFDDFESVQDAVAQALGEDGVDSDNGKLALAGQRLGVLDENNQPIGRFAPTSNETPAAPEAATAPPPVPERVAQDAIPPRRQGGWAKIEAIRNDLLTEDPNDPVVSGLLARTAALQNELQGTERPVSAIVKDARDVQTQLAGLRAAKDTPPAAQVDVQSLASPAMEPSPQAQDFVARNQGEPAAPTLPTQVPPVEPIEASPPATAPETDASDTPPPAAMPPAAVPTPSMARARQDKQLAASLSQVEDGAKLTPVPKPVMDKIAQTRAMLGEMAKNAGDDPRMLGAIQQQGARLDAYQRAAEAGMEGLRLVPPDHFGTEFYDDQWDHASPELQAQMDAHANMEQDLTDYAQRARGERPLISYSTQPTQQDADLAHVVTNNGTAQGVLGYLRQHGSTVEEKEMAAILARSGVNPKVQFASGDQVRQDYGHRLGPNEVIKGSHNDELDRINLYDGAGLEHTILHETAHAATVRAFNQNTPGSRDLRSVFDQVKDRSIDKALYGLSDPAEFVAEAFGNKTFRDFLRSEPVVSSGNRLTDMWTAFKNGVFRALGMTDRMRTLFDQVMENANQLVEENRGLPPSPGERLSIANKGVETAAAASDVVKRYGWRALMESAGGMRSNMLPASRAMFLGWTGGDGIARIYQHLVPSMPRYTDAVGQRDPRTASLVSPGIAATKMADALPHKVQDAMGRLMARSAQNIDPRKSFSEHKWLEGSPSYNVLKAEHADAVSDWQILKRTPGGVEAYEARRAQNNFNRLMHGVLFMQDFVRREEPGRTFPGFETDAFRDYQMDTALQDSPAASEAWAQARYAAQQASFRQLHSERVTAVQTLRDKIKAEMLGDQRRKLKDDLKSAVKDANAAASLIQQMSGSDERATQGPYFRLGRGGDYFAAGTIAKGENGVPSPETLSAIGNELGRRGFGDVAIMQGLDNDAFYTRVRSPTELNQLRDVLEDLQRAGHLDQEKPVETGRAGDDAHIFNSIAPEFMRRAMEAMRSETPDVDGLDGEQADALRAAHAKQQREFMRTWMSMLPDSATPKLYAQRMGVQGFSKNMDASFREGLAAHARGLANMSLAPEIGAAAGQMRKDLRLAYGNPDLTTDQRISAGQAMAELMTQAKDYTASTPNSFMDAIRRMTHTAQIGLSPIYFLKLQSQNLTLAIPELAKEHKTVQVAAALARATSPAFQVAHAVLTGDEATTFGMRRKDLERVGLSPDLTDFVMNIAARGGFNQSGRTEAIVGHDAHGQFGRTVQLANAMGRYSEMVPRLQAAFAARDLYMKRPVPGVSLEDYAYNKVMASQLNWGRGSTARQLTPNGRFGANSPLINSFMGFQTRMTTKLYEEFANGFGQQRPGESDAAVATRRAQSRKWLALHAGAVAALSGTLGLPMAEVAASVYDKLKDAITGEDNNDVIASYRTFLASAFGKEIGEAIARGAPRLLGADFDEFGEGRILPGSTTVMMATEKRKAEDAYRDWAKSMTGSTMGELFEVYAAGRDLSNGDYLNAAIRVAPELFKGPLEAARLGMYGFTDQYGDKLPVGEATAGDIALKSVGIDPAKEAEYDDAQRVAVGLKDRRQVASQNITRHLILAENRGDQASFQAWMGKAMQFQRDHLGIEGPLETFGRSLAEKMQTAAMAQYSGTPLGVSPRDMAARGMVGYGNFRNGQ